MLVFVKGGKLFKNQTIVIYTTGNVKEQKQLMLFDQKISKINKILTSLLAPQEAKEESLSLQGRSQK